VLDAFGVLRAGRNIDLSGAGGRLDFDPSTGDQQVDMAVVCAGLDAHGAALDNFDSGLVFDAEAKKLHGSLRCQ
jgi:hypothetical protein